MTIEELQARVLELETEVTSKDSIINTHIENETKYKSDIQAYEQQVTDLRNHNNFLFRQVTTQPDPPAPEPTKPSLQDVLDKF